MLAHLIPAVPPSPLVLLRRRVGRVLKRTSKLGNPVLKPFLQDVVQFAPLARVLLGVTKDAPLSIPPLLLHIGILPILDWTGEILPNVSDVEARLSLRNR